MEGGGGVSVTPMHSHTRTSARRDEISGDWTSTTRRIPLSPASSIRWETAQFKLYKCVSLQARVDFFNIFNHPNFGAPINYMTSPLFGQSTQMLGASTVAGGQTGASIRCTKSAAHARHNGQ